MCLAEPAHVRCAEIQSFACAAPSQAPPNQQPYLRYMRKGAERHEVQAKQLVDEPARDDENYEGGHGTSVLLAVAAAFLYLYESVGDNCRFRCITIIVIK
jgi:hypothetical protein